MVQKICDRVIVMEKGKIEQGDTETVFKNSKEEYTKNLISSVPVADPRLENRRLERTSKASERSFENYLSHLAQEISTILSR